ncbi:MAG: hypothetical protein PHE89_06025 [Alphaproteobacteria bacterium]|nr:hypothetical protein [Alphaproteobacteria bacterium]
MLLNALFIFLAVVGLGVIWIYLKKITVSLAKGLGRLFALPFTRESWERLTGYAGLGILGGAIYGFCHLYELDFVSCGAVVFCGLIIGTIVGTVVNIIYIIFGFDAEDRREANGKPTEAQRKLKISQYSLKLKEIESIFSSRRLAFPETNWLD